MGENKKMFKRENPQNYNTRNKAQKKKELCLLTHMRLLTLSE